MSDTDGGKNARVTARSFLRERERGKEQGEAALLKRLGVTSERELIERLSKVAPTTPAPQQPTQPQQQAAADVAAKTPRKPGESDDDYEERLLKKIESKLGAVVAAQLEPLAKKLASYEAEAKAREEADKEQKAEAEAEAALEKEARYFQRIATGMGAKPEKLKVLTAAWQAKLNALDADEFEEMFGKDVSAKDREANVRKIIEGDFKADSPGWFKPVEAPKPAETPAANATAPAGGTPAPKPATTGAPALPADLAAAANGAGNKPKFDAMKLTPAQMTEYRKNPNDFKKRWEAGEVAAKP